jgi:hypothetical protein
MTATPSYLTWAKAEKLGSRLESESWGQVLTLTPTLVAVTKKAAAPVPGGG